MNYRVYTNNVLLTFSPKNGGASAPPINEDAGFPLSNTTIDQRYKFYRTSTAPSNPIDLDWGFVGLTTFKSVGLANIRAYRGTAGASTLEVYYSTTAYPPSAWPSLTNWTQILAPQAIAATANDVMFDLPTPTAGRSWRFRIANAGQFSCRPWAVQTADVVDFTEGFDVEESIRRIRAPEAKTLLGGVVFNDLGVGKAAAIRSWTFHDTVTSAQRDALLAIQSRSRMLRDSYGNHYEVTPAAARFSWGASGILVTTRAEIEAELEQLP